MFEHHLPLKPSEHQHLRVSRHQDYRFAAEETLLPLGASELAQVAREYPIVFTDADTPMPCALTGLSPGNNAFVADDGTWRARYLPAYIRCYPFRLMALKGQGGEAAGRFALCVDPDAPHLTEQDGDAIFTAEGQLTPALQPLAETLQAMQRQQPLLERIVERLQHHGLLVKQELKVRLPGGEPRVVRGVNLVDEKRFNALDDDAFLDLRRCSALPVIYAHLLSLANLRLGALVDQAGAELMDGEPDLDTLFSANDEDFTFDFDS